jgi:hypothetical protein
MRRVLLASLVVFSVQVFAQTAIPVGTILPARLNSSLNSRKTKTGQIVTARIMQDVPLPAGSKIREGSKIIGHVVQVVPATSAGGANMSLRFDTLLISKRSIPITTNVRALASMMAVEDAQTPKTGPDRGTPEDAWILVQIGGEVVYRGGGPVANGLRVVGEPTADGVLVRVASRPDTNCRGEVEGNDRPQALWVFSSDACGTYDLPDVTITHAGRTNPVGEITLASIKGDLQLRSGSGMLLRVNTTLDSGK